jgi:hypothetical protein
MVIVLELLINRLINLPDAYAEFLVTRDRDFVV